MKLNTFFVILLTVCLAAFAAGCGTKSAGPNSNPSASPSSGPSAAKSWTEPPQMAIDPAKSYQAAIETSKGSFTIDLFAKDAPVTVNNFLFLAKQHFYDGIIFHRVIKDFMIQTGDPTGTGSGGPGYAIKDELHGPHKYEQGIVAMANAGPDTGGSQFFVCSGSCDHLNQIPNYAIFGKVSAGMDTVLSIADSPVTTDPYSGQESRPVNNITINKITITEK
jgi:cyclophilin family peptidyl-prolyl cis-trans isomerase